MMLRAEGLLEPGGCYGCHCDDDKIGYLFYHWPLWSTIAAVEAAETLKSVADLAGCTPEAGWIDKHLDVPLTDGGDKKTHEPSRANQTLVKLNCSPFED